MTNFYFVPTNYHFVQTNKYFVRTIYIQIRHNEIKMSGKVPQIKYNSLARNINSFGRYNKLRSTYLHMRLQYVVQLFSCTHGYQCMVLLLIRNRLIHECSVFIPVIRSFKQFWELHLCANEQIYLIVSAFSPRLCKMSRKVEELLKQRGIKEDIIQRFCQEKVTRILFA